MSGDVDMVVNTPSGRDARADGYEIRSAAISMDRPIITTVQELAAAVHGIEALGQGALGVRSLQEWTAVRQGGLASSKRSQSRRALTGRVHRLAGWTVGRGGRRSCSEAGELAVRRD
jgi:hypothetical protein